METESDSDVKIVPDSKDKVPVVGASKSKTSSDSDIRLDAGSSGIGSGIGIGESPEDSFLTEEIDLDAELRAAEEAARAKPKSKDPLQAPSSAVGRSGAETKPAKEKAKTSTPKPQRRVPESSSEFELSLEPPSGVSLDPSSGDVELGAGQEDEVALGEMPASSITAGSDSGINLQEPADSGISLEQGAESSDEIEFELSLDAESTPKPAKAMPSVDSSSEFELTLEDSARLAPLEEEKAKEEEKDIFETDFEVPALEDESGSQAVALDESDTDLESSDFDLALGEEDMASDEESGSQVVALEDEENVDEGAATVARPRRKRAAAAEDDEAADLVVDDLAAADDDLVTAQQRAAAVAAPADWGLFAPITLICSTVLLLFVGMMSFELLHSMWGYRQPYKVSGTMIRAIGGLVPGVDAKDLEKD
jgi:hypothetical protein